MTLEQVLDREPVERGLLKNVITSPLWAWDTVDRFVENFVFFKIIYTHGALCLLGYCILATKSTTFTMEAYNCLAGTLLFGGLSSAMAVKDAHRMHILY